MTYYNYLDDFREPIELEYWEASEPDPPYPPPDWDPKDEDEPRDKRDAHNFMEYLQLRAGLCRDFIDDVVRLAA